MTEHSAPTRKQMAVPPLAPSGPEPRIMAPSWPSSAILPHSDQPPASTKIVRTKNISSTKTTRIEYSVRRNAIAPRRMARLRRRMSSLPGDHALIFVDMITAAPRPSRASPPETISSAREDSAAAIRQSMKLPLLGA
jgi:hypothetical protein